MKTLFGNINRFFEKYEIAWESFMMALAIIFVAIGFAPQSQNIVYTDFAITIFFVTEFSIRFISAPSKKGYLRNHWIGYPGISACDKGIPNISRVQDTEIAAVARIIQVLRVYGSGKRSPERHFITE